MHRRSRIPALQALCALPRSTALFSALADADTAYPGRLHPRAEPYAKQPYKKKGGDVTLEAVMQLFAQSGASIMIHGHTHRPARHQYDTAVRWVLSDWDFDGGAARGAYLRLDREGIRSISL